MQRVFCLVLTETSPMPETARVRGELLSEVVCVTWLWKGTREVNQPLSLAMGILDLGE